VTPEMRIAQEEIFGPVATIMAYDSLDQAIEIANDTAYGLGAVIQSTDLARARRVAESLETGMVTINEAPGSAAELPFGGIKRSGFGRELGRDGMDEFVNRKVVKIGA